MNKRKVTKLDNIKFEPFDNYGSITPGMSWHKITYKKETGKGTYILKMDPDTKSVPHEHLNYEEFIMLEGELIDPDDKIFKKGDIITYKPGSSHSSYTKNGCLILVFMQGKNNPI